jgi:hypothetical protein
MGGNLSERFSQEELGEGSNRLTIYEETINMILRSDHLSLLLGHGHSRVSKDSIMNISAHNDFLECIYDYGLVVFILYILLCIYVIKKCVYLFRKRSSLFIPYAASIALFFFQSMFEHLLLYASWFNYLILFWGAAEALVPTTRTLKLRLKRNL